MPNIEIFKNIERSRKKVIFGINVQVSLVMRGRYVCLFWTANTEFADKNTHFDYKFYLLKLIIHSWISESTDKKTADNEVHLYSQTGRCQNI